MTITRRSFPESFKHEAVEQVLAGTPLRHVAQALGVTEGLLDQSFDYDDADRLVGIDESVDALLSQVFDYDLLNRLVDAEDGLGAETFSYSANGNRTQRGGTGGTTTYQYSAGSQRLASISGAAIDTLSYDAAGNTTLLDGQTLSYDERGRLTAISGGNFAATYQHNGLGQRVAKTANSISTRFVYHTTGQLLAETDGSNTTRREYIWLDNWPVAVVTVGSGGSRLDFIHADQLGTPRRITDAQQTTIWSWHSAPFGDTPADADPDGDLTNFAFNLRFPGQYFDEESGLNYNYFRDYNPATGRYVQSDPIGLQGGLNTYSYVYSNPMSRVDPLGLWSVSGSIYDGLGGGIIFGRDDCGGFFTIRVGIGAGGGVSFDLVGTRPGGDDTCCSGGTGGTGGISAGGYGELAAAVPWLAATLGIEAGAKSNNDGSSSFYGGPTSGLSGPGSGGGARLEGSAGAEFSFYGNKK